MQNDIVVIINSSFVRTRTLRKEQVIGDSNDAVWQPSVCTSMRRMITSTAFSIMLCGVFRRPPALNASTPLSRDSNYVEHGKF